jgi:hypothetical protein
MFCGPSQHPCRTDLWLRAAKLGMRGSRERAQQDVSIARVLVEAFLGHLAPNFNMEARARDGAGGCRVAA